jgi:hypothetical protein
MVVGKGVRAIDARDVVPAQGGVDGVRPPSLRRRVADRPWCGGKWVERARLIAAGSRFRFLTRHVYWIALREPFRANQAATCHFV